MRSKLVQTAIAGSLLFSLALPALAQETATGTPATVPPIQRQKPIRQPVDPVCMQAAVETRDSAIVAAWETLTSSVKSAWQARKEAVKSAWGITDLKQRKEAITAAEKKFRTAHQEARNAFRKAQQAAWVKFKSDAKACRATATYENQGSDVKF